MSLFIKQLSQGRFVHLNLSIASVVDWRVGISGIVVGVDLEVERQTLDALLGAEVGRQALHGDVHLQIKISRPLENL